MNENHLEDMYVVVLRKTIYINIHLEATGYLT